MTHKKTSLGRIPHSFPEPNEKLLKKLAGIHDKSPKGKAKRRSKIRADEAKQWKKAVPRSYKARGYGGKRRKKGGDSGG